MPGDDETPPGEMLGRRMWIFAAVLLVGATMFGAWLLWRDLGREVRTAELRSQFVSSVSHELKTPLTSIRMFAETLQLRRARDEGTQAEYLETIVNECERLTRLVDHILAFSRIEQGLRTYQLRPVGLEYVVRSAVRAFQHPMQQHGFKLEVRVAEDLPRVRADADALEQAVLNLLSNAMKYSGDARVIELDLAREDRAVVIRVTDHGSGIAPEHQARIFEKYYRAPTRDNELIPGAGLGLALVAHIAKAHGGRVGVRSAPGRGSTFLISIPLEEIR
jgi:signal transduction histidine kinase